MPNRRAGGSGSPQGFTGRFRGRPTTDGGGINGSTTVNSTSVKSPGKARPVRACCVCVTAPERARHEALVSARGSRQKHVWRARIILLTDDGLGTVAIMAETGKSKTCVWRWQERYTAEGVDGLLRDKTRPPGIAPLETTLVDEVVALTLEPPAQEATHWTVRAMAKAVGIAASSVVKIWHDHGLAPHRGAQLQAVQRQSVCREAASRGRPPRLAAGARHRAVGG